MRHSNAHHRDSSHWWLKLWHFDGAYDGLKARLLGIAPNNQLIKSAFWSGWQHFFYLKKCDEVICVYKGKVILIHLLVDAKGMAFSAISAADRADSRKQAPNLLDGIEVRTKKLRFFSSLDCLFYVGVAII